MNIFDTITALFSGERVSHTDTFILAGEPFRKMNIMPSSDVKSYE